MARRKRRDSPRESPSRGHVTVPSRSLVDRYARERVKATDSPTFNPLKPDFRPVEDLRRVPDSLDKRQTFRLHSGAPAVQVRRPESKVHRSELSVPMHDYFADPRRALVCIRRAVRKRVLFALRKVGKGKRVSFFRRFTDKSFVRCK